MSPDAPISSRDEPTAAATVPTAATSTPRDARGDDGFPSDEQLMRAFVRGDQAAFEQLYRRLAPWLHRLMALQLPQPDLAADLVQQSFLQLHLARSEFRPDARLRPWLVTIALNLKRGYFRRRKRRAERSVEAVLEGAPDDGAKSPEQAAEAARVRQAVLRLPAHEREVIVLHYYGGFSYGEIEALTGIGRSAIKQRARRGYQRLRADLAAGTDAASGR